MPTALLLFAAPSLAQEPLRRVDFAWVRANGAEGCPPRHAVLRALQARLGYDPTGADPEVSVEVLLTHDDGRWRAAVTLRDARGRAVSGRTLTDDGATCGTLTDAVVESLVLAIAPASPAAVPPPAPAPPSPPPTPAPTPAPPPRAAPRENLRARTSVSAELLLGALPSPAAGVRWHLEVALPPRGLFVWGAMILNPEQRTPDPTPFWVFGMTRAALGVAYGGAPLPWLEFSARGGLSAGLAHGVALRGAPVAPGNYGWFAVVVGGRAALYAQRRVAVVFDVEGHYALVRNTFVVEGRSEAVFAQPEFSMALGAGVELAF